MSQPETPNPEHKSNNAILCFCIGAGLLGLAWVLGFGSTLALALSGGAVPALAGGIGAMIAVVLAGISGFILMAVGGVWMMVRVIADQRASDRYSRNVER